MNFQPQAHDWGQWSLNEARTAVVRRDELASFGQALQWIEQVAALAHAHDHHPEIHNVYNRVQLTLCTHDAGGLTEKDLLLARAIDALAAAIKMTRSGLGNPQKPIGSFLFSGPTGVGKTEVAKQLSSILGIPLQRFDMSEYMERHSVSRLIGAPPGYVGFDQGGLLTDQVNQHPHSVILLDEIEKAHPDVFNVLLQVMDYGKLTDHNGRTVDFRNVILCMTTNAGAADLAKPALGQVDPSSPWFGKPSFQLKYAPDEARMLMSAAGFSKAQPLKTRFVVASGGTGQMLSLPMIGHALSDFTLQISDRIIHG